MTTTAAGAANAAAPAAGRGNQPAAEARRAQGRTVTTFGGVRLRDDAWAEAKRDHVDRIHRFDQQYGSASTKFLSILSDINFSRGVYARSECMSLVNDYLAPVDAAGKPTSPQWAAYMAAHERGAPELELARLFFAAHNEALERAKADPAYEAARASSDPRHVVLCDVTLERAEELERRLAQPGADAMPILMGGMSDFFAAHAEAGVMPITGSDVELVIRALDLNPLEALLDRLRGESQDEMLMGRGLKTMTAVMEAYAADRVRAVRDFGRRLIDRLRP